MLVQHAAAFAPRLTAHSFRVATIIDPLALGAPWMDVPNLAGHADRRTTRSYDRWQRHDERRAKS